VTLQDIYEFKFEGISFDREVIGSLEPTGIRPLLQAKFEKRGIDLPTDIFARQVPQHNEPDSFYT
jgi:hypothetical protein